MKREWHCTPRNGCRKPPACETSHEHLTEAFVRGLAKPSVCHFGLLCLLYSPFAAAFGDNTINDMVAYRWRGSSCICVGSCIGKNAASIAWIPASIPVCLTWWRWHTSTINFEIVLTSVCECSPVYVAIFARLLSPILRSESSKRFCCMPRIVVLLITPPELEAFVTCPHLMSRCFLHWKLQCRYPLQSWENHRREIISRIISLNTLRPFYVYPSGFASTPPNATLSAPESFKDIWTIQFLFARNASVTMRVFFPPRLCIRNTCFPLQNLLQISFLW